MIEIQSSVPEWLSRKDVQVHSDTASQESCACKLQITDRNQCKMILHDLWDLTQRICPGDIRRTFIESGSCVRKEQAAFTELHIRLRRRRIMDDRRMFPERGDRFEAWTDKVPHLSAEFIELIRSTYLRNLRLSYIFLKPFHESDMRDTVFYLRFSDIFNLCRIFHCLK